MIFNQACEVVVTIPGFTAQGYCEPGHPPVPLPAGQWVLIGNPYSVRIGLLGADAVYTYDTLRGEYVRAERVTFYDPRPDAYSEADVLDVAAGAFVYSAQGRMLNFVRVDLQPPPR